MVIDEATEEEKMSDLVAPYKRVLAKLGTDGLIEEYFGGASRVWHP